MKFSKNFLICLVMLTVFSCSTQRFIYDSKRASLVDEPTVTKWAPFFIGGFAQRSSFNPKKICKNKDQNLAKVEFVQTFPNILLTFITLGIYSPREARIYCAK